MGLAKEFREFAVKGNAVDMAVGLVIGASFGKIVTSLVNDVIMPPVGLILGGTNFSDLQITLKKEVVDAATLAVVQPAVALRYGALVGTALDFLIVAFALFLVVKLINVARRASGLAPKT